MENLNWCAMWGFLTCVFGFFTIFIVIQQARAELGIIEHDPKRVDHGGAHLVMTIVFGALCVLTWGPQ